MPQFADITAEATDYELSEFHIETPMPQLRYVIRYEPISERDGNGNPIIIGQREIKVLQQLWSIRDAHAIWDEWRDVPTEVEANND